MILRKVNELNLWISEKHHCERCNVVMTSMYGTGRFCSRKCANSHECTKETKSKISHGVREKAKKDISKRVVNELKYNNNPSKCCICNSTLDYIHRYNQTCSKSCKDVLLSIKALERSENNLVHRTNNPRYKYGTYKGIHCDSSWELAFVLYLTDRNICFTRNMSEGFPYTYKGKKHLFFPDYIIKGEYYEIKNYSSALTDAKVKCFPAEHKLHVLYYKEIKQCIDYVIAKYGKDYTRLYDRSYPSYMDYHN